MQICSTLLLCSFEVKYFWWEGSLSGKKWLVKSNSKNRSLNIWFHRSICPMALTAKSFSSFSVCLTRLSTHILPTRIEFYKHLWRFRFFYFFRFKIFGWRKTWLPPSKRKSPLYFLLFSCWANYQKVLRWLQNPLEK